ncbi:MAG: hypothetical protein GTO18_12510 [Anaerolineales bacterium]|nr:hypothetical protein [Anaerolineales bacterium]
MRQLGLKQVSVILVFGAVGWALCGAIMFIGMSVMDLQTTLIVHAIGAPIIFTLLSLLYFTKFRYTSPLQTAIAFFIQVILMDFFIVALLINRSFDMFLSPLGTWIPFVLIFLSTYLTGLWVEKQGKEPKTAYP